MMRIKSKLIAGLLFAYLFVVTFYILLIREGGRQQVSSRKDSAKQLKVKNTVKIETTTRPPTYVKNGSLLIASNSDPSRYHVVNPNAPLRGGLTLPKPAFQLGDITNKSDIIVGIPTVQRDGADYLLKTLQSLLSNLHAKDGTVRFVVFVGETNLTFVKEKGNEIQRSFKHEIESGILQVISPSTNYYPDWETFLAPNFNDNMNRVKWRSKQNLDQVFLMMHIYNLSPTYYLMMEDDVIANKGYAKKILLEATKREHEDWFYISFCGLGAIGKLFRTSSLASYASFLHTFWNKKPLDWLQVDYATTIYCSYDETDKQCNTKRRNKVPGITPSLFQHVGKFSSLKGKIQNMKDPSFKLIR